MPQPEFRDGHVDQLLTNVSIMYRNPSYIAEKVCPVVPVTKQSNIIPTYTKAHFFRDSMTLRTAGLPADRDGYAVDNTVTYFAQEWALGKDVTEEELANFDAPYDAEQDAALFLAEKAAIRLERLTAANVFATGKWGTDKTGTTDFTKWSTYGSSDPFDNISDYAEIIRTATGIPKPQLTLVIGAVVWGALQNHPDLLDRIKYTQDGAREISSESMLARALGIKEVIVGWAVYNSAAEGQTATMADIWADDALLYYRPDNPMLRNPAGCYSFGWNRNGRGWRSVYRYDKMNQEERCIAITQSVYVDAGKITASDAGVFMDDAVD